MRHVVCAGEQKAREEALARPVSVKEAEAANDAKLSSPPDMLQVDGGARTTWQSLVSRLTHTRMQRPAWPRQHPHCCRVPVS